jgi:Flp pilus assembly protein TadG
LGRRQSPARKKGHKSESGAELIEFAFISTILIALVYGIVFFGVTLGAKVTISQAAADGSRAGIVSQTPATAESLATNQAVTDLGWMGFSTPSCGTNSGAYACVTLKTGASNACTVSSGVLSGCATSCGATVVCPVSGDINTTALIVVGAEAACTSSTANTCLTTYVVYYDSNAPLIPAAPGLALLSPNNIESYSTQEVSTPTP